MKLASSANGCRGLYEQSDTPAVVAPASRNSTSRSSDREKKKKAPQQTQQASAEEDRGNSAAASSGGGGRRKSGAGRGETGDTDDGEGGRGGRGGGTTVSYSSTPRTASAYDTYSFFARYTYSSECALLGYNFHTIVTQLGIFECVSYPHDYRLISVTLAYIFYKYRIHHCDMALDLALTLIYLEELSVPTLLSFEDNDAFNVVCYFAFLAHVYNADRTIRLTDWYKEMNRAGAPHAFANCKEANKFVWFLFNDVRKLRLVPNEQRVKTYIQRLCAAPQLHPTTK